MEHTQSPPRPPLQNPIVGTTIDTSPSELGLTSYPPESPESKNLLSRTVDKLSRSRSLGKSKLFPGSRRGKEKTKDVGEVTSEPHVATDDRLAYSATSEQSSRPSSPSPPSRASLGALGGRFPGDGSMRMGTQTLIQALQAIPWDEDRADDEIGHGPHVRGSMISSDDEGDERTDKMASSLHTIHRPIARSRRGTPAVTKPRSSLGQAGYFGTMTSEEEDIADIDEDIGEDEDFENGSPGSSTAVTPSHPHGPYRSMGSAIPERMGFSRQGSMATVRLKRRAKLAEKLKEVFGLREIEDVVAEMPCWLLRSVLLQGYMYLTTAHICFFAHMPSREDQVLKSGTLNKKASRTKRWSKHWYVLKNDVLSWYHSSADPYFPRGNVDLRYAISCEPIDDKNFRLRTNQKTLHMAADSTPSRDEWVKAIRKVIFKAQNHGESVKISIPFSVILDVEKSSAMDFSETIEVKVVDKDDHIDSMDSYFFAYFHDLPTALEQIKEVIHMYRNTPHVLASTTVKDTTYRPISIATSNPSQIGNTLSPVPSTASTSALTSRFGLSGLFRGSSHPTEPSLPLARSVSAPEGAQPTLEDSVLVPSPNATGTQPINVIRSPQLDILDPARSPESIHTVVPNTPQVAISQSLEHSYPPGSSPDISTFHHVVKQDAVQDISAPGGWGVPSWLRNPSRKLFSYGGDSGVSEVYESAKPDRSLSTLGSVVSPNSALEGRASLDGENQLGFSMMEAPQENNTVLDPLIGEKFRTYFALDEKEELLAYLPGYLFRVLPLFGRVYISTNYFCFRSSQPLRKTMMMIPIRDIIATQESKAFRFGHQGLIVVIKGHEELFFEFGSVDKRSTCITLLEKQMDLLQNTVQKAETLPLTEGHRDALILEELDLVGSLGDSVDGHLRPPPETDILPAVMFTSTSSTFVAFKPQESLHITCLTIGSRGDCQPYIALCKRLQADGHRCRIATHLEYKDWIEGHGIEYGEVGGDPAELMRICVENGMFTYGFLKEGLQKFRGWLDDLLKSSWEACQGTDLLIESPSAMGGIHVAEALQIPYYRAFTMPYTRTRAYPHAFAVPEHKMGGSYNYMSYVMFDQVFWRAISGQINRWRRNVLGIGNTTFDKLEQHKVPFLYNFSPSMVPPPLDWYEWIRVTGYWFLDDPDNSTTKKWTPPPDLISFIDSAHALGKKVVYIGFGSIVVSDPESMTRCVVEAIQQSGVYAILSKGWSDRLSTKKTHSNEVPEIPLPPQVYPISSIPHDWLFPRIDAACHHGGAGTTGASLRAGIPTIIKPFFGDQFFWADRVEALDVGSSVRKLTVEHLTAALIAATTDIKQIDKAKLMGEAIRSENGVDTAVEAIYRDLEYARSLIKHRTSADPATQENSPEKPGPLSLSTSSPDRNDSMEGSVESNKGGASDWSVISEGEEERHRQGFPPSSPLSKRASIAATTLATLHDVLLPSLSRRISSDRNATPAVPR